MKSELGTQILRFGIVGTIGFVVDGGFLWFFISLDVSPYIARALSFPIAVVVTWALNRNWTFVATSHARPKGQFQRYFAVQVLGALSNYAVYSLIIFGVGVASATVFWALVAGSAFGAVLNFCGARYVAFRA